MGAKRLALGHDLHPSPPLVLSLAPATGMCHKLCPKDISGINYMLAIPRTRGAVS